MDELIEEIRIVLEEDWSSHDLAPFGPDLQVDWKVEPSEKNSLRQDYDYLLEMKGMDNDIKEKRKRGDTGPKPLVFFFVFF